MLQHGRKPVDASTWFDCDIMELQWLLAWKVLPSILNAYV